MEIVKKNKRGINEQQNIAYWFILVPVFLLAVLAIAPIIMALYYSFTDYNIIESPNWVGFRNFTRIFQDEFFFISLRNTISLHLFICSVRIDSFFRSGNPVSIKKLNSRVYLSHVFLSSRFCVPQSLLQRFWYWLLNPQVWFLKSAVADSLELMVAAWLYSSNWAMTAIVIMSVWMTFRREYDDFLGWTSRNQSCPYMKQLILKEPTHGKNFLAHYVGLALSKTTFFSLAAQYEYIGAFASFLIKHIC